MMVRKSFGKEQLAIIGLSASGQSDLGSKFIKNGANDFLFKPYSFEELLCRINTNIEAIEHLDYIYELANKDSLTKLFYRRYFFSTGNQCKPALQSRATKQIQHNRAKINLMPDSTGI